jgi:adenylate cyclase class 2
MAFEVEQKFPVDDVAALQQRLLDCGVHWDESVAQADRYFAHPCRDFARTDEALRIRQIGSCNCITFKGPKIDASTKTRREIELPLPDGPSAADAWQELLLALGFTPVASVRKVRRPGVLSWQDAAVHVALDDVPEVGQYVELELLADAGTLDAARERILSLARHLGLSDAERRSYLELLLERRSSLKESDDLQGGTS